MSAKSTARTAAVGLGLFVGGFIVGQLEADNPGVVEQKFRNATQTGEGLAGAGVEPVVRGAGAVATPVANTADGAPAPAGQ